MSAVAEAHPSATVVLLRERGGLLEVLMVQRSAALTFHGGAWVFPGGRIDAEDRLAAGGESLIEAARHAAVREAREEADVVLDPSSLVLFSEWTTPEVLPKRFRTWFFAARWKDAARVRVDGGEVIDHSWVTPSAALKGHRDGNLDLPHPTWVTLYELSAHTSVEGALAALAASECRVFHPKPQGIDGGTCSLFEGDAGYGDGQLDREGPRHRLYAGSGAWSYERKL
jgi:8-oxo-dGTP pyrophosphatase MutT (NUDIX family)